MRSRPVYLSLVLILALSLGLGLVLTDCGRRAGANPPSKPPTAEQIARTAIEGLNEALNQAVQFYSEQKTKCAASLRAADCVFGSPKAIRDFHDKLETANDALAAAENFVAVYVRNRTEENERSMNQAIDRAKSALGQASPALEGAPPK